MPGNVEEDLVCLLSFKRSDVSIEERKYTCGMERGSGKFDM